MNDGKWMRKDEICERYLWYTMGCKIKFLWQAMTIIGDRMIRWKKDEWWKMKIYCMLMIRWEMRDEGWEMRDERWEKDERYVMKDEWYEM